MSVEKIKTANFLAMIPELRKIVDALVDEAEKEDSDDLRIAALYFASSTIERRIADIYLSLNMKEKILDVVSEITKEHVAGG